MSEIHLNWEERKNLRVCPNCKGEEFEMKNIPNPDHPLPEFRVRSSYTCLKCGYWTDWFDGWHWHPPLIVDAKRSESVKE